MPRFRVPLVREHTKWTYGWIEVDAKNWLAAEEQASTIANETRGATVTDTCEDHSIDDLWEVDTDNKIEEIITPDNLGDGAITHIQ